MIRALTLWAALLLPDLATAQNLPALYDVARVASNDVLNVRSDSHARGGIVGELASDARGVEVIRTENDWGLVNVTGMSGWVSMRYLERQPEQDGYSPQPPLWCYGTEPFWSIDLLPGGISFSAPELSNVNLMSMSISPTNRYSGTYAFAGVTNVGMSFGTVHHAVCSDGMSDREYGLAVDFVYRHPMGMIHFTGCCSLAKN